MSQPLYYDAVILFPTEWEYSQCVAWLRDRPQHAYGAMYVNATNGQITYQVRYLISCRIPPQVYCGFDADHLNSRQPFPIRRGVIHRTVDQGIALRIAGAIRDGYGINIWVDGTVCTGWKIIVHADDLDRASRMFKALR